MSFCNFSKTIRVPPSNSNLVFKDWYIDPSGFNLQINDYPFIDEDIIFIGPIPNHYGHFITEGLSRLWPLLDIKYKNHKVAYISEGSINSFKDFFILFGLNESNLIRVQTPTQFKSIKVPEPSIRLHDYCHELYGKTIKTILKDVPLVNKKNIFLSKKANKYNGKSIGENHLEEVFSNSDFEIVSPETMPIEEFLSVMLSAEKVAALSATSAHNAIFMKEGAELICLNRSDHHHPLQIMINKIRELKVTYVDVSLNIFKPNFSDGPFNVIISKNLQNFLKHNAFKTPSKLKIFITSFKSTFLYIAYFLFLKKLLTTSSRIKNKIINYKK